MHVCISYQIDFNNRLDQKIPRKRKPENTCTTEEIIHYLSFYNMSTETLNFPHSKNLPIDRV